MMNQQRTEPIADILLLGIGNLLMGDEGLGVHFAQQMQAEALPNRVEVLEGGTAGMQLMEAIENHRYVIMVDATLDGRPAGTIREIKPKFSTDFPAAMSTHDIGLKDLVSGLTFLGKLPEIFLFVVSVAELQPMHIGLSPAVETAMLELKARVLARIQALLEAN
ncbi:MAG: hydrogenase maturation protease [Haliscomenobacter sp.]